MLGAQLFLEPGRLNSAQDLTYDAIETDKLDEALQLIQARATGDPALPNHLFEAGVSAENFRAPAASRWRSVGGEGSAGIVQPHRFNRHGPRFAARIGQK